jgi:hypothetical protein
MLERTAEMRGSVLTGVRQRQVLEVNISFILRASIQTGDTYMTLLLYVSHHRKNLAE